jgi:uncharacterized protein YecE (DUF72 family)
VSFPVRIGTSGWEYVHWAGRFYPRELSRDRWLEFYAARFDTVELNASFYRLPEAATFERWGSRVPAAFRFAVKASRYLTHIRRLKDPDEPLERLWTRATKLGGHLGPVLYQLPPRWRPNVDRLETFLAASAGRPDQVVEFRSADWYRADVLELLERHGIGLCLHDMPGSAPPLRPTGPLAYLRFHGAGERYGGSYQTERLTELAELVAGWAQRMPVWAYFNNDLGGHAVTDAFRLREEVASRVT